jgi:voltage-dependent potassium channel beta subunit
MHHAFENGINFFDNAEVYAAGESEKIMGEVIKDFRREDLVVSTKIFWSGQGPNDTGLSRKHLIEATKNSLKRLQLEYVDLLYCHRPDPSTPIAETVMAMDYLVRNGYAFYWGTSEWSADQIEMAFNLAKELNCIPPTMEQPEYNMLHRHRVEQEYAPLYKKYGLGTTIWSPLAFGLLTGKYNEGIPKNSRLAIEPSLRKADMEQRVQKVRLLTPIAQELNCTMAQLALAWCLKNPFVSTVILGATSIAQLDDNLQAAAVKTLLTEEIMQKIDKILKQSPVFD